METYTRHNYVDASAAPTGFVDIFTTERNALIARCQQDCSAFLPPLEPDKLLLCSSKPSYTVLTGCTSTISTLTAITCSRSVSSMDLLYNRQSVGGKEQQQRLQPQVFSSMSLAKSATNFKWSPKASSGGDSDDCFVQGDVIHVPRIRSLEKAPAKVCHDKDVQTELDSGGEDGERRQAALIRYLEDVGSKLWYLYDKCSL